VRVHAGGGKQDAVARFSKGGRARIAVVAAARNHNPGNTGTSRTLQNLLTIVIETVMRQVGANINQ